MGGVRRGRKVIARTGAKTSAKTGRKTSAKPGAKPGAKTSTKTAGQIVTGCELQSAERQRNGDRAETYPGNC
jgi:hypothetical protein